jgi:hypothetical protein
MGNSLPASSFSLAFTFIRRDRIANWLVHPAWVAG